MGCLVCSLLGAVFARLWADLRGIWADQIKCGREPKEGGLLGPASQFSVSGHLPGATVDLRLQLAQGEEGEFNVSQPVPIASRNFWRLKFIQKYPQLRGANVAQKKVAVRFKGLSLSWPDSGGFVARWQGRAAFAQGDSMCGENFVKF
ncbi:hypothetical protein B0T14DRAFT_528287 [Immersiella caudata]|uniref:Uncharacterized protein n=1 Tax=Immersiella caudata TaxID=314043 RepID=A0AA40BUR7_9PEZI|nr:hypothetical protein B0T14DRAFT_528287 [Immersiella caudata]